MVAQTSAKFSTWIENNLPEGLTVFSPPQNQNLQLTKMQPTTSLLFQTEITFTEKLAPPNGMISTFCTEHKQAASLW